MREESNVEIHWDIFHAYDKDRILYRVGTFFWVYFNLNLLLTQSHSLKQTVWVNSSWKKAASVVEVDELVKK